MVLQYLLARHEHQDVTGGVLQVNRQHLCHSGVQAV
jgi:hypothetical protein